MGDTFHQRSALRFLTDTWGEFSFLVALDVNEIKTYCMSLIHSGTLGCENGGVVYIKENKS